MPDFSKERQIIWSLLDKTDMSLAEYGSDGTCIVTDYVVQNINQMAIDMDATWVKQGCTKVVFYFRNIMPNYVIKLPFRGCYYSSYDENDNEYIDEDAVSYFSEASTYRENYNDWDYCETESYLYTKAKESNVEEFFAGTYLLGYYNDIYPIYISEYIANYHMPRAKDKIDYSALSSIYNEYVDFDKDTFANATAWYLLNHYGKERFSKLLKFLQDWGIDDLHSGNVFFNKDGDMKIVDYSGYNEDM